MKNNKKLTSSNGFKFHALVETFLIATGGTAFTLQLIDDTIGLFNALIVFLVLKNLLEKSYIIISNKNLDCSFEETLA